MGADALGNNVENVEIPVTGRISLVEYSADNKITPEMIGSKKAEPDLPEAYKTGALGLVTQDGAPQDSGEAGDSIEFWQQGHQINGESTITTTMTLAEDTPLTRKVAYGAEPDENGVYGVDTLTPDAKWMAYYEEAYKSGRVMRRAGVVMVTANEPGQSTRGEVKGRALTLKWLADENYDGHKYIECVYDPAKALSM